MIRHLVINDINGHLLSLENIRAWEKNPDSYSAGITNSIFIIMARTFAPPDQRLKSVIAREKQIPAVFAGSAAEPEKSSANLCRCGLEQIPGIVSFFQKDVPEAFKDVKDQALLAEFHATQSESDGRI